LRPVPAALDWLAKCGLRELENGSIETARLYEPGSNLPYKVDVLEERNDQGYQLYDFYPVDKETYLEAQAASARDKHPVVIQTQGRRNTYNLNTVVAQYERIKAASPEERKGLYKELFGPRQRRRRTPDGKEIARIINSMNNNGAWIEDIAIWDYKPGQMIDERKIIRGFSVGTYISNMRMMMDYLSK
jgi:hypothetical protein